MNRFTPWHRLIWKDLAQLRSLGMAWLIAAIGLNLLALFLPEQTARFQQLSMIWLLLPNLAALGVPAMLVGHERETGSLGWLRTLPVAWWRVADAKLLAGFLFVAAAWLVATAFFAAATAVTPVPAAVWYVPTGRLSAPTMLSGMFLSGIFYSGWLLLFGFVTAYVGRSTVISLVALVPLMVVASLAAFAAYEAMVPAFGLPWMVASAAAAWLAVAGLQRLLAWRSLAVPDGRWGSWISPDRPVSAATIAKPGAGTAFRPPRTAANGRPAASVALLWQQARQIGPPAVFITLMACGLALRSWGGGYPTPLDAFFVPVLATWLGCLAFVSDSTGRRYGFLADRGVSPLLVWWTRLALPTLLLVAMIIAARGPLTAIAAATPVAIVVGLALAQSIAHATRRPALAVLASIAYVAVVGAGLIAYATIAGMFGPPMAISAAMPVVIVVCFAIGQLVSQWARRPSLAFLASIAYAAIVGGGLTILYSVEWYGDYASTAVLVAVTLLFATARLTPRWLDDRRDWGFDVRVIAYTALALLLPSLAVFGHRWATTPAAMPHWRATMAQASLPGTPPARDATIRGSLGLSADEIDKLDKLRPDRSERQPRLIPTAVSLRALEQQLELELADPDPFAGRVTLAALLEAMIIEHIPGHTRILLTPGGPPRLADGSQLGQLGDVNSPHDAEWPPERLGKLQQSATEVVLAWAVRLRRRAAEGELPLRYLLFVDEAEHWVLQKLQGQASIVQADGIFWDRQTIRSVLDGFPDRKLRRESRRVALVREWQAYQQQFWVSPDGMPVDKTFVGVSLAERMGMRASLSLERRRIDRQLDRLVKALLDTLQKQDETIAGAAKMPIPDLPRTISHDHRGLRVVRPIPNVVLTSPDWSEAERAAREVFHPNPGRYPWYASRFTWAGPEAFVESPSPFQPSTPGFVTWNPGFELMLDRLRDTVP